jgi:5-hydroxyisourate hydrolase
MISTHVLDTARGQPAAGVKVLLERVEESGAASELNRSVTDADGRVRELLPAGVSLANGAYRLTFETGAYFRAAQQECFYPVVTVAFAVRDTSQHHHVPLLLSPFGYTTYRGS